MSTIGAEHIQTWRYHLPSQNGEGWAIIFMDSNGCFSACSDWGNVGYRWPDHGWGDGDFRKFILGVNDDYLEGKFGQNRREYDPERTLKLLTERLHALMESKPKLWNKVRVEEELASIRHDYNSLYTEHDFWLWVHESDFEERYETGAQRYDPDVTNFVAKVMPRLREALKHDLKL